MWDIQLAQKRIVFSRSGSQYYEATCEIFAGYQLIFPSNIYPQPKTMVSNLSIILLHAAIHLNFHISPMLIPRCYAVPFLWLWYQCMLNNCWFPFVFSLTSHLFCRYMFMQSWSCNSHTQLWSLKWPWFGPQCTESSTSLLSYHHKETFRFRNDDASSLNSRRNDWTSRSYEKDWVLLLFTAVSHPLILRALILMAMTKMMSKEKAENFFFFQGFWRWTGFVVVVSSAECYRQDNTALIEGLEQVYVPFIFLSGHGYWKLSVRCYVTDGRWRGLSYSLSFSYL